MLVCHYTNRGFHMTATTRIVCLEGCHGLGKTQILKHLKHLLSSPSTQQGNDATTLPSLDSTHDTVSESCAATITTHATTTSNAPNKCPLSTATTSMTSVASCPRLQSNQSCPSFSTLQHGLPRFVFMDEQFLNIKDDYPTMDPQSFLMESLWAHHWIHKVMTLIHRQPHSPDIIFTDRSPWSGLMYAKMEQTSSEFMSLYHQLYHVMQHLARVPGVQLYMVRVQADKDRVWQRVQQRILQEPVRILYNEQSREHFEGIYGKYQWLYQALDKYVHDINDMHHHCATNNDAPLYNQSPSCVAPLMVPSHDNITAVNTSDGKDVMTPLHDCQSKTDTVSLNQEEKMPLHKVLFIDNNKEDGGYDACHQLLHLLSWSE